jgi:hypothetical protein
LITKGDSISASIFIPGMTDSFYLQIKGSSKKFQGSFKFYIDDNKISEEDINTDAWKTYTITNEINPGEHKIRADFEQVKKADDFITLLWFMVFLK